MPTWSAQSCKAQTTSSTAATRSFARLREKWSDIGSDVDEGIELKQSINENLHECTQSVAKVRQWEVTGFVEDIVIE
jgi:hypothetical protein